jgi:hypothetical protein
MSSFPQERLYRYRPIVKTVASADPAAGAEISYTVPANTFLELKGARVALVASGDVATRTVQLTIDDGTTVFNLYASPSTQAASATYNYNFVAGGNNTTVLNNNVSVAIGDSLLLPAGYKVSTLTNNLQAADNFGVMTIYGTFWVR